MTFCEILFRVPSAEASIRQVPLSLRTTLFPIQVFPDNHGPENVESRRK